MRGIEAVQRFVALARGSRRLLLVEGVRLGQVVPILGDPTVGVGRCDNGAAAYADRGVAEYRDDLAEPDSFDQEEPSRSTRQRNEPLDGLDPAHRARQSAMYRYE